MATNKNIEFQIEKGMKRIKLIGAEEFVNNLLLTPELCKKHEALIKNLLEHEEEIPVSETKDELFKQEEKKSDKKISAKKVCDQKIGETFIRIFCPDDRKRIIIINAIDLEDNEKRKIVPIVFSTKTKTVIDFDKYPADAYDKVEKFIFHHIPLNSNERMRVRGEMKKGYTAEIFDLLNNEILLHDTDEVLIDLTNECLEKKGVRFLRDIVKSDEARIDGEELPVKEEKNKDYIYFSYTVVGNKAKACTKNTSELFNYLHKEGYIFKSPSENRYAIKTEAQIVKERGINDKHLFGISKSIYENLKNGLKGDNNNE